jgi:molybdopterin-dependent oxidoreductase alpha subunit
MANPKIGAAGGWASVSYVLRKAREAGGLRPLLSRLRSRNACKTCALGMGGARGGMVNEAGRFPEVCKKSVQVQAGDMAAPIDEAFFRRTSFAELERMSPFELQRLGRLAFPVLAEPGEDRYRRIGWEEALSRTADAFAHAPPEETFFYMSGRSSNEAAFLLQLVARAWGCANIHNCSYYCHSASGVALGQVYGSGTASIVLEDLDRADFALVAGANPASNHPRLITRLVELRRRGGAVVIVNPLKELGLTRFRIPSDPRSLFGSPDVCDVYVQPHVGTDVAFFLALLQRIEERGALDRAFVEAHTNGWPEVEAQLREHRREDLLAMCGVGPGELEQVAELVCRSERGILAWAMGLTHHANGTANVLALANVALARGWLGRPGAGLLPIRGHSNVQGVGSVGVSPALRKVFAAKLEELYGITVPRDPGQDTFASMEAAAKGRIRVALLLGGNLFASNPDRAWAAEALRRIPFSVSLTTHLNEGHAHGRGGTSLVLPVLARDEEAQATTQESMFNFVRISEGGPAAVPGEMRSEVAILADLAERILPEGRFDWAKIRSHAGLRRAIADTVPGYAAIAEVERREFRIDGRTFHRPEFNTPDGRARFAAVPPPDFAPADGELRLMTLRSEGQFNTVVYEEEDVYRGNVRRDVVMMSPRDARERGLAEGDPVEVVTEIGRMTVRVALVDIRPGNLAMYYPEANAIVPARVDPHSKTPAFKSVIAKLETPARAG